MSDKMESARLLREQPAPWALYKGWHVIGVNSPLMICLGCQMLASEGGHASPEPIPPGRLVFLTEEEGVALCKLCKEREDLIRAAAEAAESPKAPPKAPLSFEERAAIAIERLAGAAESQAQSWARLASVAETVFRHYRQAGKLG